MRKIIELAVSVAGLAATIWLVRENQQLQSELDEMHARMAASATSEDANPLFEPSDSL